MPNRMVDITDGVAMIVTDLHGDRDAFDRYITRFRDLRAAGEVQRLILLGDLIHGYGPADEDFSLSMVLDVIALQEELGPDTLIMLLGNHEMPHIYGVQLFKGAHEFTPRFERAMGPHRDLIVDFFKSLPFFVRTAGGVLLTHAGPAHDVIQRADELITFDHDVPLEAADLVLAQADDLDALYRQYGNVYGRSYAMDTAKFLDVRDPDDPRYRHLLRATLIAQEAEFSLLWDALFTQCEFGLNEMAYVQVTRDYLAAFSKGAPAPLHVVVSGHIVIPMGGYAMINRMHFRLASAAHARPREAGCYLLLDCAQTIGAANTLSAGLGNVFEMDEEQAGR